MGGQGGFFGSQASTSQVPIPVETIPGARGLGQALVNYFLPILQGQKSLAPYQGYASVYGRGSPTLNAGNQMTWQGSFPGIYTNSSPTPSTSSTPSTPSTPSASDFQTAVNNAVAAIIGSPSGGSGGGGSNA